MRYLHTMVRVKNIDDALDFYCNKFGLVEVRRTENQAGRFTLIFLAAPEDKDSGTTHAAPLLELTIGIRKIIRAAATSVTSPMRSTISMPSAIACRTRAC